MPSLKKRLGEDDDDDAFYAADRSCAQRGCPNKAGNADAWHSTWKCAKCIAEYQPPKPLATKDAQIDGLKELEARKSRERQAARKQLKEEEWKKHNLDITSLEKKQKLQQGGK